MTGLFAPAERARVFWAPRKPSGLLAAHFFRRFLDNDLISPNGEQQASLSFVLAALAVPSALLVLRLVFIYNNPWITPSERMLMSLDDKYEFMACPIIVMGLATLVQWDALSLDSRDLAILGPLPLSRSTLLRAKVLALVAFLASFAAATTAGPIFVFPFVWLSLLPLGLLWGVRLVAVHALTSLGAAVFAFFVVVSLRGILLHALGPRLFRRASTLAQFVLVVAFVTAFLLMPLHASNLAERLERRDPAATLSPATWFVGLYDGISARAIMADPQFVGNSNWRFWREEAEVVARAEYEKLLPVIDAQGRIAVMACAAAVLLGTFLYFLEYWRFGGQLREAHVTPGRRRSRAGRLARQVVCTAIARRPAAQATFFFTLQTIFRSARHRLYIAGYLAVGFALVAVSLTPSLGKPELLSVPSANLLAVQQVLTFFLLVGLRAAFAIPAELPANWLFRVTDRADASDRLNGARHGVALGLVVPFLLLMVPIHAVWWGPHVAALHALAGWLSALILLDVLLLGSRKTPFTCAFLPGKANIKVRWPLYLAGFLGYAYGVAAVEAWMLDDARRYYYLFATLAVAAAVVALAHAILVHRRPGPVFEDEPDVAVQALGL